MCEKQLIKRLTFQDQFIFYFLIFIFVEH